MKKRSLILFPIVCLLLVSTTKAQGYRTALGIRISSNDAAISHSVSVKHFVTSSNALEVLLSFTDPAALGLLLEKHRPFAATGLSWLYGGGAYVGFKGNRQFGAHGILGLDYKFPDNIPINLSLDWKPELNFVREVSFEPAAVGVSVRFTF